MVGKTEIKDETIINVDQGKCDAFVRFTYYDHGLDDLDV